MLAAETKPKQNEKKITIHPTKRFIRDFFTCRFYVPPVKHETQPSSAKALLWRNNFSSFRVRNPKTVAGLGVVCGVWLIFAELGVVLFRCVHDETYLLHGSIRRHRGLYKVRHLACDGEEGFVCYLLFTNHALTTRVAARIRVGECVCHILRLVLRIQSEPAAVTGHKMKCVTHLDTQQQKIKQHFRRSQEGVCAHFRLV